jgi:hypothetical protein
MFGYLPEYTPIRCSWYDPLKQVFDHENLDALTTTEDGGISVEIFRRRAGKDRAKCL